MAPNGCNHPTYAEPVQEQCPDSCHMD
ncbi:hypothetical protein QEF67_003201 [Klebsiella aerogenes]|nr:hypothetical protein [Klebsiella aerogenes]